MEPSLPADQISAICQHMNDDHADAIAEYARRFGRVENVIAARIAGLDTEGMDLTVDTGGPSRTIRIPFDHPLTDAEDARTTLVAMAMP